MKAIISEKLLNKILLIACSLLFLSCGVPKVKQFPTQEPVFVPEFPKGESFQLFESEHERVYLGNLVLWNPQITAEQFEKVYDATLEYHKQYVDLLNYYKSSVTPKQKRMGVLVQQQNNLFAERNTILTERRRAVAAETAERARNWFDVSLSKMPLNESEKDHARGVFHKYCEAKIWSFAVDSAFLNSKFFERPTPNALCEKFYTDSKTFEFPQCESSSTEKNYFPCFWRAAILNTSFVGGFFNASKRSTLLKFADDTQFFETLKTDRKLAVQIVAGAKYTNMPEFDHFEVRISHLVSAPNASALPNRDKTLASSSLFQMLNAVEASETYLNVPHRKNVSDLLRFVKSSNQEAFEQGRELSNRLGNFAKKDFLEGTFSANDVIFNFPKMNGEPPSLPQDFNSEGLPQIFAEIEEGVPELDEKVESIKKQIEELENSIRLSLARVEIPKNSRGGSDCALATADHLRCPLAESLSAQLASINAPNVAVALTKMSVKTRPLADRILEVRLALEDTAGRRARGCISLETGKHKECPAALEQEGQFSPLLIELNLASRKLSLELVLDDPREWGLSGTTNDANFCRLPTSGIEAQSCDFFANKKLRAELYPSAFGDGLLPFLSGKVSVHSDEGEILLGNANYLLDADVEKSLIQ